MLDVELNPGGIRRTKAVWLGATGPQDLGFANQSVNLVSLEILTLVELASMGLW